MLDFARDMGPNKDNHPLFAIDELCLHQRPGRGKRGAAPSRVRGGAGPRRAALDDARRQVKWAPDPWGGGAGFASAQTYTINIINN